MDPMPILSRSLPDFGSNHGDNGSERASIRATGRWYDRREVVLVAFLAGLGVLLAGAIVAAVRGLRLWRQAKRTGGAFASELSSFEERATRAERHLAEWEEASGELELALERLRVSRARLRVLLDALERSQSRLRWLRVFVPR